MVTGDIFDFEDDKTQQKYLIGLKQKYEFLGFEKYINSQLCPGR